MQKIGLNKWRLIFIILISVIFIMNGLTMLFEASNELVKTSPFLVRLIGVMSIAFFGIIIFTSSKQLFDPELGVTLDEIGLNDHSSSMAVGMINWEHITKIETFKFLWMKSLAVHTDNPEKYLREASGVKLRVLAGNLNRTKTPIVISTRSLKIKHIEFDKLIRDYWSVSKEINS